MITYNELYAILRQEKYNEVLQELPKNFINDIGDYLNEKKKSVDKGETEFDEALIKMKKQFENAKILINELFMIRQKKILNLALLAKISGVTKSDIENMLPEEKELFETVLNKLKETDARIKEQFVEKKKDLKNNMLVRFKEDVPEFLDAEGNKLGPFKKGDIANLPIEIVKILVEDKKVDTLE